MATGEDSASASSFREPHLGEGRAQDRSERAQSRADGRGYLGVEYNREFNNMRERNGERQARLESNRVSGNRPNAALNQAFGDLFVCLGVSRGITTAGVCYASNGKAYSVAGVGVSEPGPSWAAGWASSAEDYISGDSVSLTGGGGPIGIGLGTTPNFGAVAVQLGTPGLSVTRGVEVPSEQARAQLGDISRGFKEQVRGAAEFLDKGVRDAVLNSR